MELFGRLVFGAEGRRKRRLRSSFGHGRGRKMASAVVVDELDESHRHHRVTAASASGVGVDDGVDVLQQQLHASAATTTALFFELGGGGGGESESDELFMSGELSGGGSVNTSPPPPVEKEETSGVPAEPGTEIQVPLQQPQLEEDLPLRRRGRIPRLSMRTISSEEADYDDSDGSDTNLDELLSAAAEASASFQTRVIIPLTKGTGSTRRFVVDEEGREIVVPDKRQEEEEVTADSTNTTNSESSDGTNVNTKVRFGTVTVHYHRLCLGDNPSVHRGVPVALSKRVSIQSFSSLKDYETTKTQSRRTEAKSSSSTTAATATGRPRILRKTTESQIDTAGSVAGGECPKLDSLRRVRLLKDAGYSGQELQMASKQFEKVRRRRIDSRTKQRSKIKKAERKRQQKQRPQPRQTFQNSTGGEAEKRNSDDDDDDDDDAGRTAKTRFASSSEIPPLPPRDDFDVVVARTWRSFANLTYRRGIKRRERELLAPYTKKNNQSFASVGSRVGPYATPDPSTTPMSMAMPAAAAPVKGGGRSRRNSFFSMHRSSSSSFTFNKHVNQQRGGGGSSLMRINHQDGSNTSTATTLSASVSSPSPSPPFYNNSAAAPTKSTPAAERPPRGRFSSVKTKP